MTATQIDPIEFCRQVWPDVYLYDKQRELMLSLVNNDETVCPAGNMLGKDYMAGLMCLVFFLTRRQARVVTTSVDQGQLEKVLWGEINSFIQRARYSLPLLVKHCDIRKVLPDGNICPKSYIIGRVAAKEEGLLGHHLPRGPFGQPTTLMVYDEASGIKHGFKTKTDTWAHRTLIIGNPYTCENFFKMLVKAGDQPRPTGKGYYVKVIRIRGQDSPNVRFALSQLQAGIEPTYEDLVPGVLSYADYRKRRDTWDPIRQCVSLDAEFYEGADVLLYPPEWLNYAEELARLLTLNKVKRVARAIGIDPAEGGDKTAMAAVDEYGLIELVSRRTPDTSVIVGEAIAFMKKHGVHPRNLVFDRGGGGKQHADTMRSRGYMVRTVPFGGAPTAPKEYGRKSLEQTNEDTEERYTYVNMRAEMYGELSLKMDVHGDHPLKFAIPAEYTELRRQLAPIPRLYDGEGRLKLPPKNKRPFSKSDSEEVTMADLIGCSPDEADAVCMANWAMEHPVVPFVVTAG